MESGLWLGLQLDGGALLRAGLEAGVVFLLLEWLTSILFKVGTPFGPAYVTVQGIVGAEIGAPHNPGLVFAGLFMHFLLSILVLFPLTVVVHPWKKRYLIAAAGIVYGGVLYAINFLLFFLLVPLETSGDSALLINYTLFGMAAAWRYCTLVQRHEKKTG